VVKAAETSKRPKLENQISAASSGTGSSTTSQQGVEPSAGRDRVGSISSPWNGPGSFPSPSAQLGSLPSLTANQSSFHGYSGQESPGNISNSVLPGYRAMVIGSTQQQQTLAWRDHTREAEASTPMQYQRFPHSDDRGSGLAGSSQHAALDSPTKLGLHATQNHHRTSGIGQAPPLLASETTTGTTSSSISTTSSQYPLPRTPMESSYDRSLPLPSLFAGKPAVTFDGQLAPIRPSSHSPQTSMNTSYNSPTGT
jgi:hypothetical protein